MFVYSMFFLKGLVSALYRQAPWYWDHKYHIELKNVTVNVFRGKTLKWSEHTQNLGGGDVFN